jgi:hypothetical protein
MEKIIYVDDKLWTLLIFNQNEKYFSQSFSLICYSLSEPELEIDVFRYNKDFMEQSENLY